jgi:choline-sulfatase
MRILYLDLDACSPHHLSCYGYPRQTSPIIDAIAREGLRCTNMYCSDAPCLPSRTAFYQGRFGIQTGVVGHGGTAADLKRQGPDRDFRSVYEEQSFPRELQKTGYHTAMISPFGQRHAAHHYYAGFNEIHNTGKGGMESAEEVQPVIERWLDDHAEDDDWYLHINYWDIHTPYRAPMDYGNPFEDVPLPDWWPDEMLDQHVKRAGPHSAQDLGMFLDNDIETYPRLPLRITDRATLKQWIDGYDTAIRYVDDMIGRIVAKLKDAGVYEDTVIVISADHGENQGELGIYGEHATADQGTCHIPFIVKWPDGATDKVDTALHYSLDWAPTVMQLIGRSEHIPDLWDGLALNETVLDGSAQGRDELIISQCVHICQRAVRFDENDRAWLYIKTYHDGYHPFPEHMLFDLNSDPLEQDNVAEQNPDVLKEAVWRYSNWHDKQMFRMTANASDSVDPMWTVMREGGPYHTRLPQPGADCLEDYLNRLEETGRSEGAAALRARYPDTHIRRK